MPKAYEEVRDSYIKRGVSEKEAKKRAAMWWNKHHPENTNPWRFEKTKRHDTPHNSPPSLHTQDTSGPGGRGMPKHNRSTYDEEFGESAAHEYGESKSEESSEHCPKCGAELKGFTKLDTGMDLGATPSTSETRNPFGSSEWDEDLDTFPVIEGKESEDAFETDSESAAEERIGEGDHGPGEDKLFNKQEPKEPKKFPKFKKYDDLVAESTKRREPPKSWNMRRKA